MEKMEFEMVPINQIKPNPLNPRKNAAMDSEQMKKIIQERGWETGISCYKKGKYYIIMSGHRRWYAAKQLKEKEIPVFITPPPENELEELERLASAQGGKVDWNAYEWARYTFDLYNLRGGKQGGASYKELALKLGVSERVVYKRIQVFKFYPHPMIEDKLKEGKITISALSEAAHWIEKLRKKYPDIVDELSMHFIMESMIEKAENKCFSSHELRVDKFLDIADKETILKYLRDYKMTHKKAYELATGEELTVGASHGSKMRQTINVLEKRQEEVSQIDVETPEQAQELLKMLNELEGKLQVKISQVRNVAEVV